MSGPAAGTSRPSTASALFIASEPTAIYEAPNVQDLAVNNEISSTAVAAMDYPGLDGVFDRLPIFGCKE